MTIMIMIITRERVLSWIQANIHCSAHTWAHRSHRLVYLNIKKGVRGDVSCPVPVITFWLTVEVEIIIHCWSAFVTAGVRDHFIRGRHALGILIPKGNTQPSKGNGFPSFPNRRAALPSPPESLPTAEGGRRGSHDQGDDDGEDCDDGVKEGNAGVFGGESKSTRLPRTSTWGSSHSSKVWPPTPPHWRTQYVNSSLCSDMVVGWTMSTASSPSQL